MRNDLFTLLHHTYSFTHTQTVFLSVCFNDSSFFILFSVVVVFYFFFLFISVLRVCVCFFLLFLLFVYFYFWFFAFLFERKTRSTPMLLLFLKIFVSFIWWACACAFRIGAYSIKYTDRVFSYHLFLGKIKSFFLRFFTLLFLFLFVKYWFSFRLVRKKRVSFLFVLFYGFDWKKKYLSSFQINIELEL